MGSESPLIYGVHQVGSQNVLANGRRAGAIVSSKFIHAHSLIRSEQLLCATPSATQDKRAGFRMVQAEYTIPRQSPDLNFAKIPLPSRLQSLPTTLWRGRSTFSRNPGFWERCLCGSKSDKPTLLPGGWENSILPRGGDTNLNNKLLWTHKAHLPSTPLPHPWADSK